MASFLSQSAHERSSLSCRGCGNYPEHPVPYNAINHNTRSELKETEEFLAQEMNKLSVQERSEALHDVHCVGEELQEDPTMVQEALVEFDRMLVSKGNFMYQKAVSQNRAYVEDVSFRLKFLRANLYDIPKATNQLFNFLHYKAMYFGEHKIAHEITLDDLNAEEMDLLLSGFYHIQDGRDRVGRVILYCFKNMFSMCKNIHTMVRYLSTLANDRKR